MVQEDDVLPPATEQSFLSALHAKNDTTNPFGYKLGESTALVSVNSDLTNIYLVASRLGKYLEPLFTSISKNNC